MGKKISTENGQSTKLGSGHRHLKSGLVKWIYYTILIFLIIFCLLLTCSIKQNSTGNDS